MNKDIKNVSYNPQSQGPLENNIRDYNINQNPQQNQDQQMNRGGLINPQQQFYNDGNMNQMRYNQYQNQIHQGDQFQQMNNVPNNYPGLQNIQQPGQNHGMIYQQMIQPNQNMMNMKDNAIAYSQDHNKNTSKNNVFPQQNSQINSLMQAQQSYPVQQNNQIIVMPSFGTQVSGQGPTSIQNQNLQSNQQLMANKSGSYINNTNQRNQTLSTHSVSNQEIATPLPYLHPIINNHINHYPNPQQQQQYMVFNNNINHEQLRNANFNNQYIQENIQRTFPQFNQDQNYRIQEKNNIQMQGHQVENINTQINDLMRNQEYQNQQYQEQDFNKECDISDSFHYYKNGQQNQSMTSIISDTLSNQNNNVQQENNRASRNQNLNQANYYTERNIQNQIVNGQQQNKINPISTIDLQNIGTSFKTQNIQNTQRALPNQNNNLFYENDGVSTARLQAPQKDQWQQNTQQNNFSQGLQNQDDFFKNLYCKIDQKNQLISQQLYTVQQQLDNQNNQPQQNFQFNKEEKIQENNQNFQNQPQIQNDQIIQNNYMQNNQNQQNNLQISQLNLQEIAPNHYPNDTNQKNISTPNQIQKNRRLSQYKIQNVQKIQSPLPLYNKAHQQLQRSKQKQQEQLIFEKLHQNQNSQNSEAQYSNIVATSENHNMQKQEDSNINHSKEININLHQSKISTKSVKESLMEHVRQSGFKEGFSEIEETNNRKDLIDVNSNNHAEPMRNQNEIIPSSLQSESIKNISKDQFQLKNINTQLFNLGTEFLTVQNQQLTGSRNSNSNISSKQFQYSDTKSAMQNLQNSINKQIGSNEQKILNQISDIVQNSKESNFNKEINCDEKMKQLLNQNYLPKTPNNVGSSRNSSLKRMNKQRNKESSGGPKNKIQENQSSESQSLQFIEKENDEFRKNEIKNSQNFQIEEQKQQHLQNQQLAIIMDKLGLKLGSDTGLALNKLINKSNERKKSEKMMEIKNQQMLDQNSAINQQQMYLVFREKIEAIQMMKQKLLEQQEELYNQVGNLQNFNGFQQYLVNDDIQPNQQFKESNNIINEDNYQVNNSKIIYSNQSSKKRQSSKQRKLLKTPTLEKEKNSFLKEKKQNVNLERIQSNLVIGQSYLDQNGDQMAQNSQDQNMSSSFSLTVTQNNTHINNENTPARNNSNAPVKFINMGLNMNLVAPLSPNQNPHTPIQNKRIQPPIPAKIQSYNNIYKQQNQQQQKEIEPIKNQTGEQKVEDSINYKTPVQAPRSSSNRKAINNQQFQGFQRQQNQIKMQNSRKPPPQRRKTAADIYYDKKNPNNQKFEDTVEKIKLQPKMNQIIKTQSLLEEDLITVINKKDDDKSDGTRVRAPDRRLEQTISDISQISYLNVNKKNNFDDQKTVMDDNVSYISTIPPYAPDRECEKSVSDISQISRFGYSRSIIDKPPKKYRNNFDDAKTVQLSQIDDENLSQYSIPAPERMLEKTYSDISYVSRNYKQPKQVLNTDISQKFTLKSEINFKNTDLPQPTSLLQNQYRIQSIEIESQLLKDLSQAPTQNQQITNLNYNNEKGPQLIQADPSIVASSNYQNNSSNYQLPKETQIKLADFNNVVEAEKILQLINQLESQNQAEKFQSFSLLNQLINNNLNQDQLNQILKNKPELQIILNAHTNLNNKLQDQKNLSPINNLNSNQIEDKTSSSENLRQDPIIRLIREQSFNQKNNTFMKSSFQLNKESLVLSQKSLSSGQDSSDNKNKQSNNKFFNSTLGGGFYLKNPSKEMPKIDINEEENEDSESEQNGINNLQGKKKVIKAKVVHIADLQPAKTMLNQQVSAEFAKFGNNVFQEERRPRDGFGADHHDEMSRSEYSNALGKSGEFGRYSSNPNLLKLIQYQ